MLFESLYPVRITESVYSLDWEALAGSYGGVIFDIDNTLVPHGAPATEQACELFQRLRGLGMKTMLLSNNREPRVKSFAEQVGSPYIHKGGKPRKAGYLKAMERMGTDAATTLFVGDQIFTDVWGANLAGMDTILTYPVDISTDEPQITVKRFFERPFLREKHKN